jgi:ABC-type sugar transport system ATPase subunit
LDIPLGRLKVSEKQIVEISKALLSDCTLLIMDEPTAALNNTEAEALFEIINSLRDQGVAILYISHRLAEIFRLADEITVLRDGHHISTRAAAQTNTDMLITDMIGRKLQGIFPERNSTIGEEVLSTTGLTSSGGFEGVDLSLHAGEVLAVTGLVGSGITELGKSLFGDYPIETGEIRWFGSVIKPSPANAVAARIGYLPEDRKIEGILGELSVRRNITLPILDRLTNYLGFVKKSNEYRVAVRQTGNLKIKTPNLEQLVRNLSGGNQQKVALAKWLASEAQILILMEPTQGIDVSVKFEIYELIAHLSRQGVGILLISSEILEILGLAHRIFVMRNSKIVSELAGDHTNMEEILRYAMGQKGTEKELNHE